MSYQNYNQGGPQGSPGEVPASPYQLSREEKRVLKECAQESFYNRCIPFMAALGLGAYYGVHLGYMKGHLTYGAAPKVAMGLAVGFVGGKLSYKKKCEDKILRLPGGRLKESVLMLRQKGSMGNQLYSFGNEDDKGVYSDYTGDYMPSSTTPIGPYRRNEPTMASELEMERPIDTFDDSFRTRSDFRDENELNIPTTPPPRSISYDELRSQNRSEYENRRKQYRSGPIDDHSPSYYGGPVGFASGPYSPPSSYSGDQFNKSQSEYSSSNEFGTNRYTNFQQTPSQRASQPRTNFYGDVIEK